MKAYTRTLTGLGPLAHVLLSLTFGPTLALGQGMAPLASDSVPVFQSRPIIVTSPPPTAEERQAYLRRVASARRYEQRVRKVYPLAKEAADILNRANEFLASDASEREKRRYVKATQQEIIDKYEETLWSMSRTEGRILLKLIYRETNNSAYYIIKEYRSGFTATFWQATAKYFGGDLKTQYDRNAPENQALEMVIQMIENDERRDYEFTVFE